jgi:hypothetical protein
MKFKYQPADHCTRNFRTAPWVVVYAEGASKEDLELVKEIAKQLCDGSVYCKAICIPAHLNIEIIHHQEYIAPYSWTIEVRLKEKS